MTRHGLLLTGLVASAAAAVIAGPANVGNLRALETLVSRTRTDHPDVWRPCADAVGEPVVAPSFALSVAGRGDCANATAPAAARDEVEAFWMGVAEARRGRHDAALRIWREHGVSAYFLGAAIGKTPPMRETGILFIGYLQQLHADDWSVLYKCGQQLRELAPHLASAPLERAAALRPGTPRIHAELGLVASRLSRFAEAAAHYRRARALDPSNPAILQGLGEAEYYSGHFEASLEAFLAKAALVPQDPAASFWIARIRGEAPPA